MNSLAPPPPLAYASLEQARAAVNAHAQLEGYAVVIKHTKRIGNKKDGDVKALILVCSRSNPPVIRTDAGPRQRIRFSRSTGCMFKISIRRLEAGDWQVQVANGEHNHEPLAHQSAPIGIEMALKRIADEYNNASDDRKRVLLDHVLAVPEASVCNPVQVQTRDQPTNPTQRLLSQFEHVAAVSKAPVRRRQCRICQQTGHNAQTCRRQAALAPAPAPAAAAPAPAEAAPAPVD